MRDIVTLPGEGLAFRDYQREILSKGLCSFFLPATFLTVEGEKGPQVRAYGADRTGFTPLEAAERVEKGLMHLLMEGILTGVKEAANCYLMPEDYKISARYLCYSEKEGLVRCLFVPAGRESLYPVTDLAEGTGRAFRGLLEEIGDRCAPGAAEDLARVTDLLLLRRGGVDTALLSVARMKRAEAGKGNLN